MMLLVDVKISNRLGFVVELVGEVKGYIMDRCGWLFFTFTGLWN